MLRQLGRQVVGAAEIEQGAHRSIEGPGAYGSTSPSDCVYVASNVNEALDQLLPAGAPYSHPDQQRAGLGATPLF